MTYYLQSTGCFVIPYKQVGLITLYTECDIMGNPVVIKRPYSEHPEKQHYLTRTIKS